MQAKITIYAEPDKEQEILIDFEFYKISRFFERANYFVNYCRVLSEITIIPSDLEMDIKIGIAEYFKIYEGDVKLQCTIQETEKMFI